MATQLGLRVSLLISFFLVSPLSVRGIQKIKNASVGHFNYRNTFFKEKHFRRNVMRPTVLLKADWLVNVSMTIFVGKRYLLCLRHTTLTLNHYIFGSVQVHSQQCNFSVLQLKQSPRKYLVCKRYFVFHCRLITI